MQEMLDLDRACEVIVGVNYDKQFGPTILFGLGGIMVEVMRDFSLRVAPLSEEDARAMLDELRGSAVLVGVRGRPAVDREAIVNVLLKLSDLAIDLGDRVSEIDVNPLLVLPEGEGAVAADALVICGEDKSTHEGQ